MKKSTAHKIAQTIVFVLCLVWASMLLTSCGTASHSTGNGYQNHLKSKRTGHTHMTTTNRGCGWANN